MIETYQIEKNKSDIKDISQKLEAFQTELANFQLSHLELHKTLIKEKDQDELQAQTIELGKKVARNSEAILKINEDVKVLMDNMAIIEEDLEDVSKPKPKKKWWKW